MIQVIKRVLWWINKPKKEEEAFCLSKVWLDERIKYSIASDYLTHQQKTEADSAGI